MNISENLRRIRKEKGLLQKQVAAEINLKPAHYNKIENGLREPSIEVLDKLAQLYGISIDQIVHMNGSVPDDIKLQDKSVAEQLNLIQQLDEDDRSIVMSIINKMLTNKKLRDFLNKELSVAS